VASACGPMPVTGDRDTIVGHRDVTFLDNVRLRLRVLRTRNFIALAGDITAIKAHLRRAREYFAAMIGIVPDSNQVHHGSFATVIVSEVLTKDLKLISLETNTVFQCIPCAYRLPFSYQLILRRA